MAEKEISRRRFFRRAGKAAIGIGALALVDQGPRLAELTDTTSSVHFVDGQEKRLPSRSGVLVLPGFDFRVGKEIAQAITPGLELLGPVMYADYAKDSTDMPQIGKDLLAIQRKTGMEELSLYCLSEAEDFAGKLVQGIGNRFKINTIFLDDSPINLNDTKYAAIGDFVAETPIYRSSFLTTAAFNLFNFHNPFNSQAAYPDLLWNQLYTLKDGQEYVSQLAKVAKRDNSNVILLRPKDPQKDPIVEDAKDEEDLRHYFPQLRVYLLGGNQGHANDGQNTSVYIHTIRKAILQNRR